MKKVVSFLSLIYLTVLVHGKCVYCIHLNDGGLHCYVAGGNCPASLPPEVECFPLTTSYNHDWDEYIYQDAYENHIYIKGFDDQAILLASLDEEIENIGHENWAYRVKYFSETDKVEIYIYAKEDASDIEDILSDYDYSNVISIYNIAQVRANGEVVVSPNPITSGTMVDVMFDNLPENAVVDFEVYNTSQQMVFEAKDVENGTDFSLTPGDISGTGYFVYKVWFDGQCISTGQIIKE